MSYLRYIVYNNLSYRDQPVVDIAKAKISGIARVGSAEVYKALRRAIVEGAVKPGERLTEERWAKELNVSRTPVREAMTMLEAEGLITSVPNRGAVVRTFSKEEVKEIYDLRAVLEGYGARKAAALITDEELLSLRRINESMQASLQRTFPSKAEELWWLVEHNNEFHHIIVRASRSDRLTIALKSISELPLVFKAYFWFGREQRVLSNHYHTQIVLALQNRDGERTEVAMKEHIYEGRDFLLDKLETIPEPHQWFSETWSPTRAAAKEAAIGPSAESLD